MRVYRGTRDTGDTEDTCNTGYKGVQEIQEIQRTQRILGIPEHRISFITNPTFDLEMNGIEPRIKGRNPFTPPGMEIYIIYKID